MGRSSGGGRVIRADTPPRRNGDPEGREVLWMLSRPGAAPIRADLVAHIDAVELEMFSDGRFPDISNPTR